jgi:hypothetical protein
MWHNSMSSQLKTAMKNRISLTISSFELHFNVRHCQQKDGEDFDNFVEKFSRLATKAYPETRLEVVRDQFIEGLRDEYIQEWLLQEAPKNVNAALKLVSRATPPNPRKEGSGDHAYGLFW